MKKKVERYKSTRKLAKIEHKQAGQIGLDSEISYLWLTKVIVKSMLFINLGLFPSLLILGLQTYSDIKTGRCYRKNTIPIELKSISSAGLRAYLRLKWEVIKESLLSIFS